MKKFFRGIQYLFWILVLIFASLPMVMLFVTIAEDLEIRHLPPYMLATAVAMLAWAKIILIKNKKQLQFEKFPMLKPKNALALFIGYNFAFILVIAASWTSMKNLGGAHYESIGIVKPYFHAFAMFAGAMFILFLFIDLPFIGLGNYFRRLISFAKDHVSVFIVYQLAFILVTSICSGIVMLFSQDKENLVIAATGYFLFVTDGDASGGLISLANQGLSSLTAASAYYILSSLAFNSLKNGSESLSFVQKLKRMFFGSDTKQILIMTAVCILSMLVSTIWGGIVSVIFFLAAGIIWLISLLAFLRETKFILYFMNFAVYGLLEAAIPMPDLTGIAAIPLTVLTISLRVVLYSFVAMIIGHTLLADEIVANKPVSEQTFIEKISVGAGKASLLDAIKVGAGVVYAVSHPGETAKTAASALKDKAIEKWNEKK